MRERLTEKKTIKKERNEGGKKQIREKSGKKIWKDGIKVEDI